jgi:CBS domain-containing protein
MKGARAMTIAAILQNKGSEVVTVEIGTSVKDVVALLAKRRFGAVPVCDGGKVAGIMSERDVMYCLSSDGPAMLDWPVERIMTAPAITVGPDKEVMSALSLMTQRRIRHLPVVEGDRIVGLVSIGDLVKYRMDQIEQEAAAMLTYIQSV